MSGNSERHSEESVTLLERESELAAIGAALERVRDAGSGGTLLIDGPPGIGKTSLIGQLGRRAAAGGYTVLRARGSEIERDFGFGIVRQLFGPLLRPLDAEARARLFAGPASLAAAIFGMAEVAAIDVPTAEASLYGLFWLLAGLAEDGPIAVAVDDAHWSDTASLRFFQYMGRRLDGIPLLIALAARPSEPGPQAEMLRGIAAEPEATTISPRLLSEAATAEILRARLGPDASAPVEAACHEATGGNPLLIEELLVELDAGAGSAASISPGSIATMGPKRIGAGVIGRAAGLDPEAPEVVRAIAVLGGAADLRVVAALAGVDLERAASIVDGLAAASILGAGSGHRFAHPLLGAAVYEEIPAATRAASHSRAADLLAAGGAEAEKVAAHLLLCEPRGTAAGFDVLDEAARAAAERGAPDSAVTYLLRALAEVPDHPRRGELLHRLGSAEVALRDPASIGHLEQAAQLTSDPARALTISLALIEVLSIAGLWDGAIAMIDSAVERFEETRAARPARVGGVPCRRAWLFPGHGPRVRGRSAAAAGDGQRPRRRGVQRPALGSGRPRGDPGPLSGEDPGADRPDLPELEPGPRWP